MTTIMIKSIITKPITHFLYLEGTEGAFGLLPAPEKEDFDGITLVFGFYCDKFLLATTTAGFTSFSGYLVPKIFFSIQG